MNWGIELMVWRVVAYIDDRLPPFGTTGGPRKWRFILFPICAGAVYHAIKRARFRSDKCEKATE